MEFNVSSFYDGEESGKQQLNSTAFDHDTDDQTKENGKQEWKLSPIVADASKVKSSIFRKSEKKQEFKSPLQTVNISEASSSGYESKCNSNDQPEKSEGKLSMSADLSSLIANNSLNPFDSILLNSLHKSINFSPRVVFSQESCSSSQQDNGKFQWSVEQLAILKPAHISEDEIAASYRSPIPEVEEKIQEALNEYWTNNVSYIPSPDGPRFVHLPHRDGSVTTIKYGEGTTSSGEHSGNTPSLCNMIRKKEAVKAAYATSSPKQRPRSFRNMRQMRNRTSQTDLTIPTNLDIDLKKLLGEQFVYQKADEEEDDDEVFNVSVSSNVSTRRRLFSSGVRDEENRTTEMANVSNLSADEQFNESQPFNDSLSPVRKNDEESLEVENESSAATRSHVSQIAINISILNDCMMNSIDEDEEAHEKEEEEEVENHNVAEERMKISSESHFQANEYEMCDRSASANATPRHEDLDWTPRRPDSNPTTGSCVRQEPAARQSEMRRFMFDMSPIYPHTTALSVRTPIQRCPLTMPREFNIDDELEEEEEDDDER